MLAVSYVVTGDPAKLADVLVGAHRVGDLVPLGSPDRGARVTHRHSLDAITGYVVRKTREDERLLWWTDEQGRERCGYDLAVVPRATHYAQANDAARPHRGADQWATVDNVYECGCRSGH